MAQSGSCPSLRKIRVIEIHGKCQSFQLSPQTFDASCQQGRFYLQNGGQLGLQSLLSPRHRCACPRASSISQPVGTHSLPPAPQFPSPEQRCAGSGRQRVSGWDAGLPPALRRRRAPRAALLLSSSPGSRFYCAIKLLPPLRDKPARRRRARITLDQ